MTNELIQQIETFLRGSGFDVADGSPPFAYVAQNASVLVFVIEATPDIEQTVKTVTALLASPFRSKRFGPKTMEMYCIFVADEATPVSAMERLEQDLKFFRKIIVTISHHIPSRLCFLQPLSEALTASVDIDSMFWSQMDAQLSPDGVTLLRSLGSNPKASDELLDRLTDKK